MKRLLRRPFVRDVGILQLGSLATLGISFLLSVLLARALGREGYGAYALIASTMGVISLLKRLGHDYVATTDLASAYARQDAGLARHALTAFNVINLWSTLAIIPLALLVAPLLTGWFFDDVSLAGPLRLALLPPIWAMLLATVMLALQCSRRVVALSILENASMLTMGICGLALAILGWGVSGVFLGQAAASLLFAAIAVGVYHRVEVTDPLLPKLRAVMSGAAQFPPRVWRELKAGLAVALDKNLVSLYPLAPVLLLGALAPVDYVALLRVAMSYAAVPLLALSPISRLLMVKLPELRTTQPERVRHFFLQVTAVGGATSLLLTAPFILLAPWLINLLYGSDFVDAAQLVPLLALDPLLAGFGIAAGPIFRTYERNLWAVWANLGVLALGLPAAYLLIQLQGIAGAAFAYAALITAVRVVAYLLCLRILSEAQGPLAAA